MMAGNVHILDLPLLLTGIPAAVQGWLRQAGVPFAPFRLGCGLSASDPHSGRIVLYDSRSVASRSDAEAARSAGLRAIDVVPFLAERPSRGLGISRYLRSRPRSEASPGRFFLQLKKAVERAGGVWARIGDYPFPWRSAACSGDGRFLPEFSRIRELFPSPPEIARAGEPEAHAWISDRYSRGLPFALPHEDAWNAGSESSSENDAPLLWRAEFSEFARWWRMREQLSIRVQQNADTYIVACDGVFSGFRPALELWQGDHVASLPLVCGEWTFRRDGLVFAYDPRRHPAGFTSQWTDRRPEAGIAWREPQPA